LKQLHVPAHVAPSVVEGALDRSEQIEPVEAADAYTLLHARGSSLDRLLALASARRDAGLKMRGQDGIITYSKKVFLPITTLCRDRCHYCTFVESPSQVARQGKAMFMSREEILETAHRGAEMGCKEALFTLGDRPEARWPAAKAWLGEQGYDSTIEYIRAMALLVLEETGLLPHLNPGVMTWAEMQRLRPVSPSMGMMLETTSAKIWSEPGGAHYGSPDKDPAVRLMVLDEAGRSKIPFTTGVLLGIGESPSDRIDALLAIKESHLKFGHIQETIVQNFRAKPRTAMRNSLDLAGEEYAAAIAVARLIMGPTAVIQAPPNLSDPHELDLLIRAGINDWGGVSPLTPDHVNPERPWPHLGDLARLTANSGFELRERLTAHPSYVLNPDEWIDSRLRPHVASLADTTSGLAQQTARACGRAQRQLNNRKSTIPGLHIERILARAAKNPSDLADAEYIALLGAEGNDLEALADLAHDVRKKRVGDDVTFVVNVNLNASLIGNEHSPPGSNSARLSLEDVGLLLEEAWNHGATEACLQGALPSGGSLSYADVVRFIKKRCPKMHLHGFGPSEILIGASRAGVTSYSFLEELRASGLDSIPGTGARILNDDLRTRLMGTVDMSSAKWMQIVKDAHRAGLTSTATLTYGHYEKDEHVVQHLRLIMDMQDEFHGFSELIPMPYVPDGIITGTSKGVRGANIRRSRAVHAVARLMLDGRIDNIQVARTKIGLAGSQMALLGGANDLGGVFLRSSWNGSGAETGREMSPRDYDLLAGDIGMVARPRTTTYGVVPESQWERTKSFFAENPLDPANLVVRTGGLL
jgi:FO synthase